MTATSRRRLLMSIGVVGVGVFLAIVGLFLSNRPTEGIPVFAYVGQRATVGEIARLAVSPWETVTIAEAGEAPLVGLLRRPVGPEQTRYVVHFVGNGPAALAEAKALFVAADVGREWGILTVAPRGFDASAGTPSTAGLEHDADRIVAFAKTTLKVDVERSVFSGYSMGALFAARASVTPCAGVVLWAPFAVVDVVARAGILGRLQPMHRYDTLVHTKKVGVEALVIRGSQDKALNASHAKRVLGTLSRATETVVDAGHQDIGSQPLAMAAFRAFLADRSPAKVAH